MSIYLLRLVTKISKKCSRLRQNPVFMVCCLFLILVNCGGMSEGGEGQFIGREALFLPPCEAYHF
jgi:hypothetical protein